MEALGFDQAGALEPEAGLSAMLSGPFEHTLLNSRLLSLRGAGKDPDFAVGKNPVDVEKNEFNFAGASGSG